MEKGPLVYAVAALAGVLLVLSFLSVAFPDSVESIAIAGGVVSVIVIVVLMMILVRTRRGSS